MIAVADRGKHVVTVLRWAGCLALVLALHASMGLLLLRRNTLPEPPSRAPDAVMLDLAPEVAASKPSSVSPSSPEAQFPPSAPPPPVFMPAPEPPQPVEPPPSTEPLAKAASEAPPEPAPQTVTPPPLPSPPVVLPEPPIPSPPPRPSPRPQAQPRTVTRPQPPHPATATATRQTSESTVPTAAPMITSTPAATAAPASNAVPGWRSELVGRLQRAKRYPDTARERNEQGVAAVTFTIDRSGHVLSVTLVRGSGSRLLDEEAVALVHRADPLPPVPAELAGPTFTLTVPVAFSLQ